MDQILPGVFHWTSFHEGIGERVHSYYLPCVTPAVLIDPRVPEEGIGVFDGHPAPRHALLTNRHHYRHSGAFQDVFDVKVWCHRAGLHAFSAHEPVQGFAHGDELPGTVVALKIGALCPEETAFLIPCAEGLLAIGDAIVRVGRRLAFVPDTLMGADPQAVKRDLRAAFRDHLERRFDHLLFAHGAPYIEGGKAALRNFLEAD